jgi:catalase
VLFDAIYVISGDKVNDEFENNVKKFIQETYVHYKPLALSEGASKFLNAKMKDQPGVTAYHREGEYASKFIADVSVHRHWDRNINIL